MKNEIRPVSDFALILLHLRDCVYICTRPDIMVSTRSMKNQITLIHYSEKIWKISNIAWTADI